MRARPSPRSPQTSPRHPVTAILNLIGLAGFVPVYRFYRHRDTSGSRFAKEDPMFGMQVEIGNASAHRTSADGPVYFCSDHWAERYDRGATNNSPAAHDALAIHDDPATHDAPAGGAADGASFATEPVCGMDVDPATATITAEHAGQTVYFCGPGCREALLAGPDRYAAEPSPR